MPHTPPPPSVPRRYRLTFLAVTAAVVLSASAGTATSPNELRRQRRQVQEEAALVAAEVDALTAEIGDLEAALTAASANVDAQQAATEAAERAVVVAEETLAQSQAEIVNLEAEQAKTKRQLEMAAVESYVSFQGFDAVEALTSDPWATSRAETLASIGTGSSFETIDQLRQISSELDEQRDIAAAAAIEADAAQAAMEQQLAQLTNALAVQQDLLNDALDRQDHRLGEAAALAELDAELAEEIRQEEQRIADELARLRRPSNGGVTVPPGSDFEIVNVQGFFVNALIEDELRGLLAAMSARGFELGGGGYRNVDRQIELRRSNCGTSDYAIWEMPASQCRPPTARPGRSQHEVGLAIDFTYQGRIIRSTQSAVFQALRAIAADYGFYNLPGEPWHWSTTGN
jgi:murein DD-endopeptidase MepM/ murein hydrolase activator NlpD